MTFGMSCFECFIAIKLNFFSTKDFLFIRCLSLVSFTLISAEVTHEEWLYRYHPIIAVLLEFNLIYKTITENSMKNRQKL